MKKIVFLVLCGLFGIGTQAQGLKTKYIQIKDVYHFQDEFNQYRVNSFLKHQLEEAGYVVFYESQELPAEVKIDPCNMLKCNVERDKSMLATQLQITLVNCKNEAVFTASGESRLKEHRKSHVDAIKNALAYTVLSKKKE